MSRYGQKAFWMLAAALLAAGVTISATKADDDGDEEKFGGRHVEKYGEESRSRPVQLVQTNARFQQECSGCHVAYAPKLLPAESWRKIMSDLDRHFGTDASLDDQDNKEITDFLVNNASSRWRAPAAPLRITETGWFKREHNNREIALSVWKNPKVKSPANCGACHPQAERGDFNEHGIRVPG